MALESQPRLLVVMPALNEAITIGEVIDRVPRQIKGISEVLICVVDDGSTDETAAIGHDRGAIVISHGGNRGVGAAMQSGMDEAVRRNVDFMVNIDADGQFAPEDIPTLLQPLLDGTADFATASRFKDAALSPVMPWVKRLGNWGMARIVSGIVRQHFDDVSCGFRAYSRETLLRLVLTGSFTYTQESFLLLARSGARMAEIPMKVRGVREHGKSRIASNVFNYGMRTSNILYTVVRDYSPQALFGPIAALLMLVGTALATFFFGHYFRTGAFSPHVWAGFVSSFLIGLAVVVFAMGQVAVMVARLRMLHERELYILRRYIDRHPEDAP